MSPPSEGEPPATEIASFAAEAAFPDLPSAARRTAKRSIIDTIGVMLAGAGAGAGEHAMEIAAVERGETTLIGRNGRSSLFEAVFANATAGHALDFDDTALAATDGHPSTPMVAPLLAIGERDHASGRDLLTAYVIGFETQAYLDAPITPGHYEGGWHATSTLGTFGAAAATATLLDLSRSATATALNVAASLPAGLKRNFGTMTKPIHVGHAARAGVTAALLAAEGIDADPNAIDGERGFFDLYSGDGTPVVADRPSLGEEWKLLENGIDLKKYPCCHYTHAAIHATATLARRHGLAPEDVDRIHVEASRGATDAVVYDDPATPAQAKFSMPYLVAYALVNGTIDLDAFDGTSIDDPAVQAVRERVRFTVDGKRSYTSNAAAVAIETATGAVHDRVQERPPGAHGNPLSDDERREKFVRCGAKSLGESAARETFHTLDSLPAIDDIATIAAAL